MDGVKLRWLGVAGIELQSGGEILAIDPFFTRPSFWRLWFGRVQPDGPLIEEKLPRCHTILVTHGHYDHLMDVPAAAANTGALVLASANACQLLRRLGVPEGQIRQIQAGDTLERGPYQLEILPAEHIRVLGFGPGPLKAELQRPLRLRDYRMDASFCVSLQASGMRLLVWCSEKTEPSVPADVLFLRISSQRDYLARLLSQVQPRLIIPIHWDDLFRPLSLPMRPFFEPPRLAFPPLRRANLGEFQRLIAAIDPGVNVLVPEVFRSYDVNQFLP